MHDKPWRFGAAYIVLLIASHVTETLRPPAAPSGDYRFADVHVVDHGKIEPRIIHLAYRDSEPDSTRTPVLLVHGSPRPGYVLLGLANLLSPQFRVIVPDLPGFGESTHDLPDYSFRAHGEYLVELLDALHVPKAQLVGFSMGGGVVLSMDDLAPQRVASIVMLSAIGVQEQELTGNYEVNHLIHGAQLAVIWLVRNAVPHFGLYSKIPYTLEYARNFFDSDQRPLRGVLERYRGPMLILHGTKDRNVPIAAARQHHQIVPQSEIFEFEADHYMTITHPGAFVKPLIAFLSRN